jgi:hypothetical protein
MTGALVPAVSRVGEGAAYSAYPCQSAGSCYIARNGASVRDREQPTKGLIPEYDLDPLAVDGKFKPEPTATSSTRAAPSTSWPRP